MTRPRVVLAVTIDDSLQFLRGYPELLVERGWDVHVVSTPGVRLSELSVVQGVTTHAINMERTPNPLRDIKGLFLWLRLIRRLRPDAVSVGTPKAGLLGTLAAWIMRVPARIYLLRGLRLETSSGIRRRLLALAERVAMASASSVVAVSHSLADLAASMHLASATKIQVLGLGSSNGVDTKEFRPGRIDAASLRELAARVGIDLTIPVIGFVGRLTRDKGLHVLADAVKTLQNDGMRVQVLLLGGVDDETGKLGLRLLKATGSDVFAVGHVREPSAYYSLMSVLCLPSYREGFVNVILEASASGVPVVASDATGVRDAVVSGRTGLTSAVGDAPAMAANLANILLNPALGRKLGANGREWVVANFERDTVQTRYAQHLEASLPPDARRRLASRNGVRPATKR